MMLIQSYVSRSSVHGNGLFAGEDIKKGACIWEYIEGLEVAIPVERLDSLPQTVREYVEVYSYPDPMRPGILTLDGDSGRFMNHSDTPNTDFTSPRMGYALADIPAGTELTCNYGDFIPGFVPYGQDDAVAHVIPVYTHGNGAHADS